jgi:hypothetical protein
MSQPKSSSLWQGRTRSSSAAAATTTAALQQQSQTCQRLATIQINGRMLEFYDLDSDKEENNEEFVDARQSYFGEVEVDQQDNNLLFQEDKPAAVAGGGGGGDKTQEGIIRQEDPFQDNYYNVQHIYLTFIIFGMVF